MYYCWTSSFFRNHFANIISITFKEFSVCFYFISLYEYCKIRCIQCVFLIYIILLMNWLSSFIAVITTVCSELKVTYIHPYFRVNMMSNKCFILVRRPRCPPKWVQVVYWNVSVKVYSNLKQILIWLCSMLIRVPMTKYDHFSSTNSASRAPNIIFFLGVGNECSRPTHVAGANRTILKKFVWNALLSSQFLNKFCVP